MLRDYAYESHNFDLTSSSAEAPPVSTRGAGRSKSANFRRNTPPLIVKAGNPRTSSRGPAVTQGVRIFADEPLRGGVQGRLAFLEHIVQGLANALPLDVKKSFDYKEVSKAELDRKVGIAIQEIKDGTLAAVQVLER